MVTRLDRRARPTLVICGMPRCGSSLTMQMLDVAGVDCDGIGPSFEASDWIARGSYAGLEAHRGGAVKFLDAPLRIGMPDANLCGAIRARFVLLRRDAAEQGRSTIKIGRELGRFRGSVRPKELVASIRRDYPRLRNLLETRAPVLELRFEDLIESPRSVDLVNVAAVRRLASFAELPTDAALAMARCVLPRPPQCLPDLSLEVRLVLERYPEPTGRPA